LKCDKRRRQKAVVERIRRQVRGGGVSNARRKVSLPTLSLLGHSMRVLRHDPINAQTKAKDPGNGSIIDFFGVRGLPTLVKSFAANFTLHIVHHGKYCECSCIALECQQRN